MYTPSQLLTALFLLLATSAAQAAYVKVNIQKTSGDATFPYTPTIQLNGWIEPGVPGSHKFQLNSARQMDPPKFANGGHFSPLMFWSYTSGPVRPICRIEGKLDKHVEFVEFTISDNADYLFPCGYQHGIQIVCDGPKPSCNAGVRKKERRAAQGRMVEDVEEVLSLE